MVANGQKLSKQIETVKNSWKRYKMARNRQKWIQTDEKWLKKARKQKETD